MDPPAWKKSIRYEDDAAESPSHHQPDVRSEPPSVSAAALQDAGLRRGSNDSSTSQEESIGVPHFKGEEHLMVAQQQVDRTIPLAESVYIVVDEEVRADPATLPAVALPPLPPGIDFKNTLGAVKTPALQAKPAASIDNKGNTSNVLEERHREDSEDGQLVEEGPTEIPAPVAPRSSNKPNPTAAKSPHVPPKAEVNRQPGMYTSNKPHSNPTKSPHSPPKAVVSRQLRWNCKRKIWLVFLVLGVLVVVIVVTAVVLNTKGDGSKSPTEEIESPTNKLPTQEKMELQMEDMKLLASDGAAHDHFGSSVTVDGDIMVIGAPEGNSYDDDNDTGGSAYVFTLSETVWTEQVKLTASDIAAYDHFGSSVAIKGDIIVIGAGSDSTEKGIRSGSVYVYTWSSGSVWTERAKLTASDGAASNHFGNSVAMDADTIVIGASGDDAANGGNRGSAYVYTRSSSTGTVWTEETKLKASGAAAFDRFGTSVAMDGDTIVIGSTASGINNGSAYVYTYSGNEWTEQAKLTASDGTFGDQFGTSVGIAGDTIVIGADRDDTANGGTNSGSAYVYTHSSSSTGTVWTEQTKLTASDGAGGDWFGISMAMDGDTIVIGALEDDSANGRNSGGAYVYTRSSSTGAVWTEQAKLTASDGAAFDRFGTSVAMDGDTIVIGASQYFNDNGHNNGSAYIFA